MRALIRLNTFSKLILKIILLLLLLNENSQTILNSSKNKQLSGVQNSKSKTKTRVLISSGIKIE